jgi:hypothetical protein
MAVVDSMHCILEGLVHYHCRRVLHIDAKLAKRKEVLGVAFEYNWPVYDSTVLSKTLHLRNPTTELEQIPRIQARLVQPVLPREPDTDVDDEDAEDDDAAVVDEEDVDDVPDEHFVQALTDEELFAALMKFNLAPLRFVLHSVTKETDNLAKKQLDTLVYKKDFCERLVEWVSGPLALRRLLIFCSSVMNSP